MKENDISQMPIMDGQQMVGAVTETEVLKYLLENPLLNAEKRVTSVMGKPFPMVDLEMPFRQLGKYLNKEIQAVVARDKAGTLHVLTQYDVIQAV